MLTHFGCDVAVLAVLRQRLKALQRILRLDHRFGVLEGQTTGLAPLLDLSPPFGQPFGMGLAPPRFPHAQQVFEHMGNVPDDRHVDMDHLVDRGGVDIDMRLFGFRAERVNAPRDPVIKPRADIDHQIAAMHGHIGLIQPVHAQHPHPLIARGGVGTQPHQGGGDRKIRLLRQLTQQRRRAVPRIDDPAARIDDGPFRGLHHFGKRGDLLDIAFQPGRVMAGRGF